MGNKNQGGMWLTQVCLKNCHSNGCVCVYYSVMTVELGCFSAVNYYIRRYIGCNLLMMYLISAVLQAAIHFCHTTKFIVLTVEFNYVCELY